MANVQIDDEDLTATTCCAPINPYVLAKPVPVDQPG